MTTKLTVELNRTELECAIKEYLIDNPEIKLDRKLCINKIFSIEPQYESEDGIQEIRIELSNEL